MCIVIGVVVLVMFVVVPQLGTTIMSLGTSLQNFAVNLQSWGEKLFQDNQEIVGWINSLEFNWDQMIQTLSLIHISLSDSELQLRPKVRFFCGIRMS